MLHVVCVFAVYPQWLLLACLCLSLWFVRSGFWLLRSCIVISTRVLPLRSVWRGRRFVILFATFVIVSSRFVFECIFISKLVLWDHRSEGGPWFGGSKRWTRVQTTFQKQEQGTLLSLPPLVFQVSGLQQGPQLEHPLRTQSWPRVGFASRGVGAYKASHFGCKPHEYSDAIFVSMFFRG